MLDYTKWLERAVAFPDRLREMPDGVLRIHNGGKIHWGERPESYRIEKAVGPPLTDRKIRELEKRCRLPIPAPLKRFWKEASGHLKCSFWWNVPAAFHQQVHVALPNWSAPCLQGGPDFLSYSDTVSLLDICLEWADGFGESLPKDNRFWKHSLPVLPFGNGDYIAFYLGDQSDNPPLAYLCHEGCGASGIIAPSFDAFLTAWEELGYLRLDYLLDLPFNDNAMIDLEAMPVEAAALRSLWNGEVRYFIKPKWEMTKWYWNSCTSPEALFQWLRDEGLLNRRKLVEFIKACRQHVWGRLGPTSREAYFSPFDIISEINQHLDEPELSVERAAQIELIRKILGIRSRIRKRPVAKNSGAALLQYLLAIPFQ